MKTHLLAALVATLTLAWSASALPDIAILAGGNNSGSDFDDAVRRLAYEVDFYRCNNESIRDFCAKLPRYKLVMVDSLFNYRRDGKWQLNEATTDYQAVRNFVTSGGVLVIADACYGQVRGWLSKVDPALALPKIGNCNSSQWAVLGHTVNVDPVDPIRTFPNRITQGNSWPHFEKAVPEGWRVLANCSEGFPVTLMRRMGKGLVVASALRQPGEKLLENYYAAAQLLRAGISVKALSLSPLALGDGLLEMELSAPAAPGTRLIYELTDAKGKVVSFATNFTGSAASLPYRIASRGQTTAKLWIDSPASGRSLLFTRTAVLPALLRIDPPAYRGILSTKRRLKEVQFRVRLSPLAENLKGTKLALGVYDSLSNLVFSAERVFATADRKPVEPPTDFEFPLALPQTLSAGGYEVRARLSGNGIWANASAAFEILAPRTAQTVVDEDKTFLVNGKPFFPLGIYHVGGDYAEVAALGFNMIQFWKWSVGDDGFGSPSGLNRALGNGLRVLFESNHYGEHIYKDCGTRLGSHDGLLMWYVGDEPAEGAEDSVRFTNDCWHKYDKHHPTYLLSCREDLFDLHATFGDVFAFDVYGTKKDGVWSPLRQTARWMQAATKATRGRKALICVPWSNPSEHAIIRPVAYTALANDARGLIWYPWKQAGGGPVGIGLGTDPACQKVLKDLIAEIKGLLPGLLSPNRRCLRPMEGKINAMVCGTDPGKRFLIMTNPTDERVEAAFDVDELAKAKTVKTYPAGEPVELFKGRVVHIFQPHEVLVYRF